MPTNTSKVHTLLSADNPLYHFIVVPIMKMARGFFPSAFSYGEIVNADLNDFVANQKGRATKSGLYSNKFLRGVPAGPDDVAPDGTFLGGLFYWHFRVLNLTNKTFDLEGPNPIVIPVFCVTEEEESGVSVGYQIKPAWMQPRKRLIAEPIYPEVPEVRATATGRVNVPHPMDTDDDESADDYDG
jgi:hypothetical protein